MLGKLGIATTLTLTATINELKFDANHIHTPGCLIQLVIVLGVGYALWYMVNENLIKPHIEAHYSLLSTLWVCIVIIFTLMWPGALYQVLHGHP